MLFALIGMLFTSFLIKLCKSMFYYSSYFVRKSTLFFFLCSGLTKLQEATVSVNELKVDLAIKEKELVVASAEVDAVSVFLL